MRAPRHGLDEWSGVAQAPEHPQVVAFAATRELKALQPELLARSNQPPDLSIPPRGDGAVIDPPATTLPAAVMAAAGAPNGDDVKGGQLIGMAELVASAKIPDLKATHLQAELLAQGAVHVRELVPADWESLQSWSLLLPFEKRRLLACFAV